MESIIYERIKKLCADRGISISKLEAELGFGNSSIKKWEKISSPSIDKVLKVAKYFDVSLDYLLGRTEIEGSITSILEDEDVISFQRAREKMPLCDRERMMQMLKIGFDYAFKEDSE